MKPILDRLWDEHNETPFSYRVHKPASTIYKLTKPEAEESTGENLRLATGRFPNDSDSGKGKPLIGENEAVTGQNEQIRTNDPYPDVPAELKALPQWVLWMQENRNGKSTKIPKQVNGHNAQANQANTWTDYQAVCKYRHGFTGIGFVFSADDPYCGIDLDNCLKAARSNSDENGQVKTWALPIVDRLKPIAYGEISPSGS